MFLSEYKSTPSHRSTKLENSTYYRLARDAGAGFCQLHVAMTAEQALRYARLSDGGDPRSVAAMGPKPALNLVLTGAQVDDALAELEAIERDLDVVDRLDPIDLQTIFGIYLHLSQLT